MSATETPTTTDNTMMMDSPTVVKVERYDEDIMRQMLVDERISSDVRKSLSNYYRHSRITPSKATVQYELSKNCLDARVGRLYPVGGCGLQSFPFDIRNPLLSKYYFDVDIENAHYNIALKLAKDFGIPHDAIERYCKHRDECLAMISDVRKVAKVAFLKIAYGGDLSLYRSDYEDITSSYNPDAIPFIRILKNQMDVLAEFLWNRNPNIKKIKSGKENKAVEKRPNNRAILMSYVLQTEERKILRVLDSYMTSQGRSMGVLIHDGGCVERLDGELEFPQELLIGGSEAIKKTLGYDVKLAVKSLEHSYSAPERSANEYAKMKADFEKRNFLVGAILNSITHDGVRIEYKISDARIKFANHKVNKLNPKTLEVSTVPFLNEWLEDRERRDYERCDFIPNRERCPPTVFNLFNGFRVEEEWNTETEENGMIGEAEMMELIAPILKHNEILCGGDAKFFIYWQSNIIQNPDIKSDVACFFRDKGGLLFEGGGTGKNHYMDWFGRRILGEQYYLVVDDNSLLYGQFNSIFEGKLLVFVEEAEGKDNHNNTDKLKSKITKRKAPIKKKMVAEYDMNDYARWVFGSNNPNPLPIKQGDRRFAMWDVDTTYRENKEYFESLTLAMENRRVRSAWYQYLKSLDIWRKPIDFQLNRPITNAYIDIRQMNSPAHIKWLRYELVCGTLPIESGARELYERFRLWYSKNGTRDTERMLSETAFGKLMKEAYISESEPELGSVSIGASVYTRNGTVYRFDYKKLIDGLEKLHQLKKGECAIDAEGCLIKMVNDE